MKIHVLALILASSILASAQQPKLPRKAPELAIQTAPDTYLWLSQYTGKTCIVAFILTTCPHCQFTTGVLNRIQKDYASRNVQVLASAIDPMSSLQIPGFQKQFMPAFPVGYNDQNYIMKFLGLPANDPMLMPHLVFVDAHGTIRAELAADDTGMA
jgi:cytochrome oxidase Cu insertion factor (SCO1/SenC/PrrC family)